MNPITAEIVRAAVQAALDTAGIKSAAVVAEASYGANGPTYYVSFTAVEAEVVT